MGVVTPSGFFFFFCRIKTQKKLTLGIFFGHFDEKKFGGTYKGGGRVSRQSSGIRGWLPLREIVSRHFEKYLHAM